MSHPALEGGVSLSAMFGGEVFEVVNPGDVQDGVDGHPLLRLVRNAGIDGLKGCYVCPAKFEVGRRFLDNDDRVPWAVAAFRHQNRSAPMTALITMSTATAISPRRVSTVMTRRPLS